MLFGIDSLYFWLAVIIISVAVEAFTLDLCAIWFAAGGVAALVAASCGAGATPQLLLFAVLSAVMLLLLRPFCRRFLKTGAQPTNADRIIGQTAVSRLTTCVKPARCACSERNGRHARRTAGRLPPAPS